MPKDFINAAGSFGEGFLKTLQSERERKQKELEFNQKMSFETRQMNLMNQVYTQRQALDEQQFALDKDKAGVDIRSGYNEMPMMPNAPLFPILQGGVGGGEKNKDFGSIKPFQEDKFYAPKTTNGTPQDMWEVINPNATQNGKKGYLLRNKVDNTERFSESYLDPNTGGSDSGDNKESKGSKGLTNKYEVDAFNRLRNPGLVEKDQFGNEIYANTPEQKDADFNTVANTLLTPRAFEILQRLRKGTGDYPTEEDILLAADELSGADRESVKSFLPYYRQIETTLAPVKTVNKWLK